MNGSEEKRGEGRSEGITRDIRKEQSGAEELTYFFSRFVSLLGNSRSSKLAA